MHAQAYRDGLLAVIQASDETQKAAILAELRAPADGASWTMPSLPERPGRPPSLTETAKPARRRRGLDDPQGRRRFLHAIYQIELSAVDLACLLCLRAPAVPSAFHQDHLSIARDEAIHAGLLASWLRANDYPPGSEPVHFRLWDTACAAADIGEQLVVIPRFLEARGLDVTAEMLPRLAAKQPDVHDLLERIYFDELRHVSIGTRWHRWWCEQQQLSPLQHFVDISRKHFPEQIPSTFALDRPGRLHAGFWPTELDWLSEAQLPDMAATGAHQAGPHSQSSDIDG